MSLRLSYLFAVLCFLLAAFFRLQDYATLPPGLSDAEIDDVRISETVRQGRVEVFYNLNGEGREGLYHIGLTGFTAVMGSGGFAFRLPSLLIGMIGLALVYALATRLCGPLAGLAAIGLLAVNFSAIVLARTVARDAMLTPWVAAVMLALARAFFVYGEKKLDRPDSVAFAALGVLLGLGFYLHPLSLVITLFALTFIVYRVFSVRPFPRRALSFTWFTLVVVIVLAMPYFLSSIQLQDLAGTARLADSFPASLSDLVSSISAGLNGLIFVGDLNPTHNLPGRPLVDLVSGVLMVLGLLVALRGRRESGNTLVLLSLVFIVPAVLLAPVTPNFQVFSILLPTLALLFGMGVSTLYTSARGIGRGLVTVGLLALFAFNIAWVGRDLFIGWPENQAMQIDYNARLGALARAIDRERDLPTLICTRAVPDANPEATLTDAEKLVLMMHHADVPLRLADCGTGLVLADGGEDQRIILLEADGLEAINPQFARWIDAGELLTDPALPPNAVIRLRAADLVASTIGAFTTTSPITFASDEPDGFGVALPPLRLEGNLTFLGYETSWSERAARGDLLAIVTYWRVDGALPGDVTLFAHVQDDPGARPAAQRDTRIPLPGLLMPRDILVEVSYINLPFTLRPGRYSVSVGAYEGASGRRLIAFLDEQPRAARLYIGGFTVE